jgi:hypothetical protein
MVIAIRPIDALYAKLGDKVKENVSLALYICPSVDLRIFSSQPIHPRNLPAS